MSYFIIQVKTNSEKYVLKILGDILNKKDFHPVKSIYALDTKIEFQPPSNVNPESLRRHLNHRRIRNYLNDRRNNTLKIKTEHLQSNNVETKEIPFIRGYIIVEIHDDNIEKIPTELFYDIKSVPKVVSIPSLYKVPDDEIHLYFSHLKEQINERG